MSEESSWNEQPAVHAVATRILVVEDNLTNQMVARGMLDQLGHRTVTAGNGEEALAILAREDFDLVFMDVQMPGMSGLEATARIRSGEARVREQGVPIVAMTAHAGDGDRQNCLDSGMDDYITKPVTMDQLAEVIGRNLYPQRADEAVAAGQVAPPGAPGRRAPFQRADFLRQVGDDEQLYREILQVFVDDSTERMAVLRQALDAGDAATVAGESHTIKGGALNVQARSMSTIAAELEAMGRRQQLEHAASLLDEMAAELNNIARQI